MLRLATLAVALVLATATQAAEVIHRFNSVVEVARDGTLTVTETIRVRAEGNEIKRGIYRDFPLRFRDASGRNREVDFNVLSVTRDGQPESWFTKKPTTGVVRIYAGKEDVFVSRGDHTYVLRYTTGRQIRWIDGKPELNWNVTGNFWTFPILAASYRLTLPGNVRPVRWTAYTGPLGARGTDWRGTIDASGALTVSTTRLLAPHAGLTVVAEIPAGAVEPPNENYYWFKDNRHWIIGGIGFVAVVIYYLMAWSAVGRDPRRGTIIPLFHPPKGVSPGLANYVHNWGFGRDKWRAFTAAAISLATRGLVLFDDKDEGLRLKATGKQPAETLPPGEAAIFDWVKTSPGGEAQITKTNGTAVAKVGDDFTESIVKENKGKFFKRNLGWMLVGVVMSAIVIGGIIATGSLQDEDLFILFAAFFVSLFVGFFAYPVLSAIFSGAAFQSLIRAIMSIVFVAIFLFLGIGFLTDVTGGSIGDVMPALQRVVESYPFPFLLAGGFAMLNGLFFYLMKAPTALGRPVMDQLEGFRMYMETAEQDRLNMQAPEITAQRFETLLPYAIALDVEKPWSEAFASALQRAYPGDSDAMRHYSPRWRTGSGWSGSSFGNSVSSTVGTASAALAASVPSSSSSGFSGGGGSGGGGGGGGGGGW